MNYDDYEKIKADIKEKLANAVEWILAAIGLAIVYFIIYALIALN